MHNTDQLAHHAQFFCDLGAPCGGLDVQVEMHAGALAEASILHVAPTWPSAAPHARQACNSCVHVIAPLQAGIPNSGGGQLARF